MYVFASSVKTELLKDKNLLALRLCKSLSLPMNIGNS